MKFKSIPSCLLTAALALASTPSQAHGVKCGGLSIAHPYASPSLGAHKTGAVYFMHIKNEGQEVDQLLGGRTDVSASVEIHEMTLDKQVMKMRAIPEVPLPAGFEVSFRHGQSNGYHLMLIDLKQPLKEGDRFPVMLQFRRAGECKAEVWVEAPKPGTHTH